VIGVMVFFVLPLCLLAGSAQREKAARRPDPLDSAMADLLDGDQ